VCLGVESVQMKAACAELSDAADGHQHSSSTRLRAATLWPFQGEVSTPSSAVPPFVLVCAGLCWECMLDQKAAAGVFGCRMSANEGCMR
jgi:hypothetical protein